MYYRQRRASPLPLPVTYYYTYTYPYHHLINNTPPLYPFHLIRNAPPLSPTPLPLEDPTRTILLTEVPRDVTVSTIVRDLESLGEIRAVEMDQLREGLVTVHFFDLRQAAEALYRIHQQHILHHHRLRSYLPSRVNNFATSPPLPPPAPGIIGGHAVWGRFISVHNQGTLVVSRLDSDVTNAKLKEMFEAFGSVKEVREPPYKNKKNPRYVEFYDTRDAAKALVNMNGAIVNGKKVDVKFSGPGSLRNRTIG